MNFNSKSDRLQITGIILKTINHSPARIALLIRSVLLLLTLSLLLGISQIQAQDHVDILEADLIDIETVNGKEVRKILGNVFLKSIEQDLEMYCDSAYQYLGSSEIRAFGNIQINTENEKIWADSLVYFTDIDFSQLRGRVIIEADSTTLFGNSVDYRFSTKVAHFIDQIRLEDPEGVLTANSGFYYREPDSAVFRGQVQLRDSTQYIEGDSLFSNRGKEYYEMYGDIYAEDGENNSTLKGDYLESDSTGRRLLTGNAWLKNVKTDTVKSSRDDTLVQPQDTIITMRPDSRADPARKDTTPVAQTDTTTRVAPIMHEVQTGETLFSIAQNYNVSVQNLKQWNNFNTDLLRVGQTLLIDPTNGNNISIHTVGTKETLFSISKQYDVSIEEIKSWNNLSENTLIVGQKLTIFQGSGADLKKYEDEDNQYTVKKGDSLFRIAREHNMTIDELKELNNLTTNNITVGQRLTIQKPSKSPSIADPIAIKKTNPLSRVQEPAAPDTSTAAEADTTHIRASRILSFQEKSLTDTSAIVNAYEDVRIWSPKFSSISDTSRYDDSAETFELWSNAKSWNKEVQLSGPYIKVLLEDGDVDQLQAYPRPFAVQQDTSLDRLNQIKGDTLNAYFEEGDLSKIHVFGGSHLLRFTKNEQDEPDGAIDMTAPSTRIFFEDGELVELKSEGTIKGSYLPESEQTEKRRLDGFIWTPKLRPERPEQKMTPRFTPIPVERPFILPQRYVNHVESKSEL